VQLFELFTIFDNYIYIYTVQIWNGVITTEHSNEHRDWKSKQVNEHNNGNKAT